MDGTAERNATMTEPVIDNTCSNTNSDPSTAKDPIEEKSVNMVEETRLVPMSSNNINNALVVSTKGVSSSSAPEYDPWQAASRKAKLLESLLDAIQDDDLHDIHLISRAGDQIPASRFVLAARSKASDFSYDMMTDATG